MRLINADELLKYMETTEISQCIDGINKGNDNYSSTALYDYIKEIPTAYDADKVVEQLEEKSFIPGDRIGASEIKIIMAEKAIEIVKSGGIE